MELPPSESSQFAQPTSRVPSRYMFFNRCSLHTFFVTSMWASMCRRMKRDASQIKFPICVQVPMPEEVFQKLFAVTPDSCNFQLETLEQVELFFDSYHRPFADVYEEFNAPVFFHFIFSSKSKNRFVPRIVIAFSYKVYHMSAVGQYNNALKENVKSRLYSTELFWKDSPL